MDLQPLYDVQERLEHAAIAGTGILSEDFRLARARQALAPLAAASPVFAKITAGLDALLAAPPEKRGGALLDVLALVDAVAYTQASSGAAGELEPLPPGAGRYEEIPYSQLSPLLEALTGTGGGRYSVVRETYQRHPAFFADYRVLPALVDGLGDSYVDLADLNAWILGRQGPELLPLLTRDFDPKGGRGMARRVEVIAKTAGAQANELCLAQHPQAKKEVRMALIDALSCAPSNAALLLELCQTERKGEGLVRARRALLRMDAPEAEDFWDKLAQEEPEEVLELLAHASSRTACRLTARLFQGLLDWMEANPDAALPKALLTLLEGLLQALEGKTGPEIAALYRRLAGLPEKQVIRQAVEDGKRISLRFSGGSFRRPAAMALSRTLLSAAPDQALLSLAVQLPEQGGDVFLAPALAARLLTQSPEAVYVWAEAQLFPAGSLRKQALTDFSAVLDRLHWDEDSQRYRFFAGQLSMLGELAFTPAAVPPLDMRWFPLLARIGMPEAAQTLLGLLHGRTLASLPPEVSSRLYRYAMDLSDAQAVQGVIDRLERLGWTEWSNFVVQWAMRRSGGSAAWRELVLLLDLLPVPAGEKLAQYRALERLAGEKKVKIRSQLWAASEIQERLAVWEQETRGGETHV